LLIGTQYKWQAGVRTFVMRQKERKKIDQILRRLAVEYEAALAGVLKIVLVALNLQTNKL
jgi:hypothetical protein